MKKRYIFLVILVLNLLLYGCENKNSYNEEMKNVANISSQYNNDNENKVQENNLIYFSQKTDPGCPEGSILWSQASDFIGEMKTVYGKVESVAYRPDVNGGPTFINIGDDFPSKNRVTVVIWEQNRGNFSPTPENQYLDKYITITGCLYNYDGLPQIESTSPSDFIIYE